MQMNTLSKDLDPLPIPFDFGDRTVRTAVDTNGNPWWWAVDVYEALEVKWSGSGISLRNVPEDWFCTLNFRGQRGTGDVVLLSEPGLYRVLMRSNSALAIAFCNWLASEVIPAIRKQGFFGTLSGTDRVRLSRELRHTLAELPKADAFARQLLLKDLRCICGMLGYPMPDTRLIGADPGQLDLDLGA